MNPSDEMVLIVDAHNRPLGAEPRHVMRSLKLPHRAVYILVFNSKGELFRQKRTLTKDIYPGCYDIAAGGVVLDGESNDRAAERELEEELGISGTPLIPLFSFCFEDSGNKVFGSVYRTRYDGEIVLQKEEIESGQFCPLKEILKSMPTEPYTPDGIYVLKEYLKKYK
ncbi:MAG: NUDIX domain-containing protein [Thermodesulfobacteriota bacterium]